MAADGHFASQNVLLGIPASLLPSLRHGWIFHLTEGFDVVLIRMTNIKTLFLLLSTSQP